MNYGMFNRRTAVIPSESQGTPWKLPDRLRSAILLTPDFRPVASRPKVNMSRFNGLLSVRACTETMREVSAPASRPVLMRRAGSSRSSRPGRLLQLEFDPAVFGVGYDSL